MNIKTLISSLTPKTIGIHISDGELTAIEETKGIIYTEDTSATLPAPFWGDPALLQAAIKRIFQAVGAGWMRATVIFCVPPYITDEEKRSILESVMKTKTKRAYLVEEFFIAALGAKVYQRDPEIDLCKKIFLQVKKETSCLGIVFAGSGVFYIRVIPKGYGNLTIDDLRIELTQLINCLTPELPEQLKNAPIPKKGLALIEKAWRDELVKRIYINIPRRYKTWGETLDEYQLVYTEDGEEAVNKGLAEFLSLIRQSGFPEPKGRIFYRITLMAVVFIIIIIIIYINMHAQ